MVAISWRARRITISRLTTRMTAASQEVLLADRPSPNLPGTVPEEQAGVLQAILEGTVRSTGGNWPSGCRAPSVISRNGSAGCSSCTGTKGSAMKKSAT